jgi:hypothetical protein
MSHIREIKQLFHAAIAFFRLARAGYSNLSPPQKNLKVKDIANSFEKDIYKNNEKRISIVLSYLSSAAIRISTIYEVLSLKPSNKKLYGGKLVISNIHYYLRDNVAHKEPDISAQEYMEKRQKFIDQLSVEDIYVGIEKNLGLCRSELIGFNRDFQNLAKFVKKYKI